MADMSWERTHRGAAALDVLRSVWVAARVAGIAVVLAACSGTPPIPPPDPNPSLVPAADSVTIIRGQSGDVGLVLADPGVLTGAVDLAVTGLPANVTATFTPATLSSGSLTATLRLDVAGGAAESVVDITITATGGGLDLEAVVALQVTGLTVNGRVRGVFDSPLAGQHVVIQGHETTTADDGTFTLSGLSWPYDVAVYRLDGDGAVHVFEALTSDSPVLWPAASALLATVQPKSATLTGTVLEGGAVPVGSVLKVCLAGFTVVVTDCDIVGAGETTYALEGHWFSSDSVAASLHALMYTVLGNGSVAAYDGYVTVDLSLGDGAVLVSDLPPLEDVSAVPLNIAFDVPGSMAVTGAQVTARFSDTFAMHLPTPPLVNQDSLVTLVPSIPGTTFDVFAGATDAFAWRAALPAGNVTMSLPAQPALIAPANGATGIDLDTEFSVDTDGLIAIHTWSSQDGGPRITLTTPRSTVTVPDTTPFGLPVLGGAQYLWSARAQVAADMNVAAAEGELVGFELMARPTVGGQGMAAAGGFANSEETRSITFALQSVRTPASPP
ncbi:MAG TPA: hypothetical protein VFN03_13375 [Trueperaceae bacterium]|nr:hypothetical protein [Trueperaceae bacterium]